MANDRIDEQRIRLKSLLGAIVKNYKLISHEMKGEIHSRGSAQRSLGPKSGDFIFESEQGITSHYTDSDGVTYQISINRK